MDCRGIEPWHVVEMRPMRAPASDTNLCIKLPLFAEFGVHILCWSTSHLSKFSLRTVMSTSMVLCERLRCMFETYEDSNETVNGFACFSFIFPPLAKCDSN